MREQKWFTIGVAVSLSAATFASPIGTSMDQPWHRDANGKVIPINYSYGFDPNLAASSGSQWVARKPWSGSWWATRAGSIAIRWRMSLVWNSAHDAKDWRRYDDPESNVLHYHRYSAKELSQMRADHVAGESDEAWEETTISDLSPIEKLDIVSGHADPAGDFYPNLEGIRNDIRWTVQNDEKELDSFHGICNGNSQASVWLPEPQARTVPVSYTLPNGKEVVINVVFGSGDLEALAAYFYSRRTDANKAAYIADDAHGGMNAAALHLLLTNLVWDSHTSFVMDTEVDGPSSSPVWNYPVIGFEMNVYGIGGATGYAATYADRIVHVTSVVHFRNTSDPSQDALGRLNDLHILNHTYNYTLELMGDRIVGGTWDSGSDRPDFAWVLKGRFKFTGDYAFLEREWKAADHPSAPLEKTVPTLIPAVN
jgi:hypothetical protein